jgi:hypothetical protein
VLALIGIVTLPLLLAGGFIRLHVVVLKDAKTKKIHEKSAHLAAEATAAVKTVAALTREGDVGQMYAERLKECMRISMWVFACLLRSLLFRLGSKVCQNHARCLDGNALRSRDQGPGSRFQGGMLMK